MRILHVSSSGKYLGGAEHALYELVSEELACGMTPVVVVPDQGSFADQLTDLGVQVHHLRYYPWVETLREPLLKRLLKRGAKSTVNLVADVRFRRIVRCASPDVVHINTSVVAIGSRFRSLARRSPIVWHVREINNAANGRVFWRRHAQIRRILSSKSTICVSHAAAVETLGQDLPSNVEVIYDDVVLPTSLKRSHDILFSETIDVSIIGPVMTAKGQLEAAAAVLQVAKDTGSNIKLNIIGPIVDREYRKAICDLIEPRTGSAQIVFTGPIDHVAEMLTSSDIVLVCSRSEAFGRVAIEGMYAGCIVIGARNTCTEELLADGRGYLYDNDAHGLLMALTHVINNPTNARAVARAAQAFALGRFSGSHGRSDVINVLRRAQEG